MDDLADSRSDPLPDADAVEALGFRAAVYAAVCCIPHGRVLGYGQVAAMLGSPRGARQVGFALAALPPDSTVPWWRVIRTDGTLALQGDPARGPRQAAELGREGVEVVDWRVEMARFGWTPRL